MPAPEPIAWGAFAEQEPELARFGKARLTDLPAYLATVRRSGAPRVHPVTPIFASTGLFLFMEPTSPKGRDLRERGWFALHSGVPDDEGTGGEFWISGIGRFSEAPGLRSEVMAFADYPPAERYVLFELRRAEARANGYGDVELPEPRRWSIGDW